MKGTPISGQGLQYMTRSTAREIAVHFSYEAAFSNKTADELLCSRFEDEYYLTLSGETELYTEKPDKTQQKYITRVVRGVCEHAAELDGYIQKYSIDWDFGRISTVSAAIMRVAMYEILYMPDIPNKVAISEAVEITRKYETEETVSFVNGILGSFVRNELQ